MRKALFVLTGMKRIFDGRPLHAQLVVTYECNLTCEYCHEFTHGAPMVPYEVLRRRVDTLADLGASAFDLLGGEPLLHPDIVRLVRHTKQTRRGVNLVSIITNAFKLTPELIDGFNDAGLDCMQVSVDTVDPTPGLPKSLRSVVPRLRMLADRARFPVKIQTVLTEESWRQYAEFRTLLAPFDFEFGFSLLHDADGKIGVQGKRFAELLDRHELFPGMAFFRKNAAEMLVGDFSRPWKCTGGFKYLYVNADGRTQYCSQVPGGQHQVEDLTLEDLRRADTHKPCEAGCAMGCVRTISHALASPVSALGPTAEILGDFMRRRTPRAELPPAPRVEPPPASRSTGDVIPTTD